LLAGLTPPRHDGGDPQFQADRVAQDERGRHAQEREQTEARQDLREQDAGHEAQKGALADAVDPWARA
jgi:hypothetical protein